MMFGVHMGMYYGDAKKFEVVGDRDAMKNSLWKAIWVPAHGFEDENMNNLAYDSNTGTSASTELPAAFAAVMGSSASKTKPSPASSPVTSQVTEAENPDLEPQPAKPKFCTTCGNRLDLSMKFCGFCGSRVE